MSSIPPSKPPERGRPARTSDLGRLAPFPERGRPRSPEARGLVGLGDLARLVDALPSEKLDRAALFLGFEAIADEPSKDGDGARRQEAEGEEAPSPGAAASPVSGNDHPVPWWRPTLLSLRERREPRPVDDVPMLTDAELCASSTLSNVPAAPPLAPWHRLWPVLRDVIHAHIEGREPDVSRLVRALLRGEAVRRIPRKVRKTWASGVNVWVDRSTRLIPFFGDQDEVRRRLEGLCGRHALRFTYLDDDDLREVAADGGERLVRMLTAGPVAPVIVLGDLGQLAGSPERSLWVRVGRRLVRAGVVPTALVSCPTDRFCPAVRQVWDAQPWERTRVRAGSLGATNLRARAERLLRLASPAHLMEPGLLREIRRLLPAAAADAGTEADVWAHPDVQGWHAGGLVLRAEPGRRWRERAFASEPRELLEAVAGLIDRWHGWHPEALVHTEALIWELGSGRGGPIGPGDPAAARRYVRRASSTVAGGTVDAGVVRAIVGYGVALQGQLPASAVGDHEIGESLVRFWAVASRHGRATVPAEIDPERLGAFLPGSGGARDVHVRQVGARLLLASDSGAVRELATETGSHVGMLRTSAWEVLVRVGSRGWERVPLAQHVFSSVELVPGAPVVIASDLATLVIEPLLRPGWATEVGRDSAGLWAAASDAEVRARWVAPSAARVSDWEPARELGSSISMIGGSSFAVPAGGMEVDRSPVDGAWVAERVPDWANEGGVDSFGLWAAVDVRGVELRLRWIPPGRFLMGSPEGEAGRDNDERQHEVTLTRGYWLGETPVTQALWKAVVGKNPSEFKSDDRPVEQVSWDDCRGFIRELNALVPGLDVRLPTEAEWEHACRAGTVTATWVGDLEILGRNNAPVLDAVAWYGGNCGVGFELENGWDTTGDLWKEKQYEFSRGGTHPVMGKDPNPFGLYDMLGNVYEWCRDWQGAYPDGPVTDPTGPETGSFRVFRGGSWFVDARYVRAAYRYWYDPADRYDFLGLRLARGQEQPGPPEAATEAARRSRPAEQGRGAPPPEAATEAPRRSRPAEQGRGAPPPEAATEAGRRSRSAEHGRGAPSPALDASADSRSEPPRTGRARKPSNPKRKR